MFPPISERHFFIPSGKLFIFSFYFRVFVLFDLFFSGSNSFSQLLSTGAELHFSSISMASYHFSDFVLAGCRIHFCQLFLVILVFLISF